MSITRWNPIREADLFQRRFNALVDADPFFARFFAGAPLAQVSTLADDNRVAHWQPSVDIRETPEHFVIHADLPGVEKKDIAVTVDGGVLTIKGERKTVAEDKKEGYHRIERFSGSFLRSFTLPERIDTTKVIAGYSDGVLEVKLPKVQPVTPAQVNIEVK
jgi:HSP20 family protein